ncbi:MAG: hypothetical protein JRJ51_06865 [Deltaproteobacteria bacterium]|nr:hypothetical protein [Deltaproteobacteria bacterium]
MTHSLHRKGDAENLCDDYVMLIMTPRDQMKDPAVKSGMRQVWDILSGFEAELTNFGAIRGGGRHKKTMEEFKEEDKFIVHAVFKEKDALKSCLAEMKEKDIGLSVSVSGIHEEVKEVCSETGLTPHTVQYSLGILGNRDKLPEENVLNVSTMCGHAMVSPNLISHLIGKIGKGKMTHGEAAMELSRQCECGIFNPHRAERLLREMV